MKKSHFFLIAASLLIVVSLSACNLSLPTPKAAKPGQNPNPQSAAGQPTQVMDQILLFATQTAQASQGQPQATPANVQVAQPTTAPVVIQPAATPIPVQPTPVLTVPGSYTLQAGEFPFCIARRFNIDPQQLLRVNGLGSHSITYPGMTLNIPQNSSFPGQRSWHSHPTTYTVRSGDTIFSIACWFGDVDPYAIAAVNGLAAPYALTAGQNINIP